MNRPRVHDQHLPRNVYLRHGAYYYVKGGKWTNLGRTLAVALTEYARRFESPANGLEALIDRTLEKLAPNIAVNTRKQYAIAGAKLKKVFREFGDVSEVKPVHIAQLRAGMSAKPNMANRVVSVARQVFDQALEEGLIESNPALGVKRLTEKKRDRLVTLEELMRIYAHAGERLQVIIDLLVRTGQRINDVLSIRRADITDAGIYFRQQKTGSKVLIPMTSELDEVITRAKHLNGNIRALTLLHNRRGKRPDYSTVKIQWDKARTAAGVEDVVLHDLRAMAATWSRRQGLNPTALLGHTSAQQTVRYLRDREATVASGPSFGRLIDKDAK